MVLFITTLTAFGHKRQFSLHVNVLEDGLEAINRIATNIDTLLEAHLLEGNSVLTLPIEAFDGEPLLEPIQALEEQYNQILDKPLAPSAVRHTKLVELISRQRNRQEAYIAHLQTAIACTQQHLQRTQENIRNEFEQGRVVANLTLSLERYQAILTAAINQRTRINADLRKLVW